jgi:hypothetical protein
MDDESSRLEEEDDLLDEVFMFSPLRSMTLSSFAIYTPKTSS